MAPTARTGAGFKSPLGSERLGKSLLQLELEGWDLRGPATR
jgi:hypothetical protein